MSRVPAGKTRAVAKSCFAAGIGREGDTPLPARGYRPLDPRLSACSSRLCNNPGADGRGPEPWLTWLQAPAFLRQTCFYG
jgi:hypothetical protein